MTPPLLSVRGLSVSYGDRVVLCGIDLDLNAGETLALVGLSGCGKSTLLRALLGLLPATARVQGQLTTPQGRIDLQDRKTLRRFLGRDIGFVAQNPFDACAPLRTVRAHLSEAWRAHGLMPCATRITTLCNGLGLAETALDHFPHEWSGGMLQRANIAAAVALSPQVLLADEPTSAVDARTADAVMSCLRMGAPGVIVVSHDLPRVAAIADRIALIEDGRITATARRGDLETGRIPPALGAFLDIGKLPAPPAMEAAQNRIEVHDLAISRGGRRLISGLSFAARPGEMLGIAGPSGVGKSSLLATLAGWLGPDDGTIRRDGEVRHPRQGEVLTLHQDALASMNPRWSLERIVCEPLTTGRQRLLRDLRRREAGQALASFGLGHIGQARTRPEALSMGQAQRVTLARASLARPGLILADEPTSALDPRQKAAALAGLTALAQKGAAVVLVSHDRAMLDGACHRVLDL